jgi:hypothetical protein
LNSTQAASALRVEVQQTRLEVQQTAIAQRQTLMQSDGENVSAAAVSVCAKDGKVM